MCCAALPVEFSEPDDPLPASRRRPASPRTRRGGAPPPPRQPRGDLLKRRLIGLAAAILLIVLFGFAVRGCLDARKERNYENYLRDLSALVSTSNQLSSEFFSRLRTPGDVSKTEFQDQVGSSRGTGEDLLRRAQGLDTPGELGEAQEDLNLAFELRRDGLASISEQMPTALGNKGRLGAIQQIVLDMRQFLASDVLYARAKATIERVLEEQGLSGEVPASVFLGETNPWLDEVQLTAVISQVSANTGAAGDDLRGTELSSATLRPGNVPLVAETTNTLGQAPTEIEIAVLNGGAVNERGVAVSFELVGGLDSIQGQTTISRIPAGATESAVLAIEGEIPTQEELTLTVTALPVPGETIVDNNEAIYQVLVE